MTPPVGAPYQARSATSRAAAAAIVPAVPTMRARVLDAIVLYGPICDGALARLLDMSENSVRPRRVDLARDGLIVAAGSTFTPSGRRAVEWVATPTQPEQGAPL